MIVFFRKFQFLHLAMERVFLLGQHYWIYIVIQ